ncbi:hypothetical protein NKH53_30520 [Mesorhizobium australicum]|uniref:hypothetical protein n=1 Tax=Mesorhizobium australicum TaxID=536018 RepID=UPI0033360287
MRRGRGAYNGGKIEITRRGFLGGVAATPIAAAAHGLSYAQGLDDIDAGAALYFILSDDQRSVVVRRVPPVDKNGKPQHIPHQDWVIEAAALGPGAWFDLDRQDYLDWDSAQQQPTANAGLIRRRLAIRDVAFGRYAQDQNRKPLYVTFHFASASASPWNVAVETNVWPYSVAKPIGHGKNSEPGPLHEFIAEDSSKRLSATVPAKQLDRVLKTMFDEQLTATDNMAVELDASLLWSLKPVDGRASPISALGGCVVAPGPAPTEPATDAGGAGTPALGAGNAASDLTTSSSAMAVGWIRPEGTSVSTQRRRLVATGPALWKDPLTVAATAEAPQIAVGPGQSGADGDASSGDLFVGQLDSLSSVVVEGGVDQSAILTLFAASAGVFQCVWPMKGGTADKPLEVPMCTDLPLGDVTITRIVSVDEDCRSVWRDVVSADAAGRRSPPDNRTTQAGAGPTQASSAKSRLRTPIGTMTVGPLPVDTSAAAEETKKETEAERRARKAALKFDAVSAAAIGDRGGVSGQTFYLLTDRISGPAVSKAIARCQAKAPQPKRKTAVSRAADALRRLYADVALYELGVGLSGTSDSSMMIAGSHFRFDYGDGLELPSLVLPEVAWSTPDGHLWLGSPDKVGEIAALDLGRAKLYARRDSDLVDLRFQFADFILVFSRVDPADGSPARIERMLRPARADARQTVVSRLGDNLDDDTTSPNPRDDYLIDARPILAVEFPPQHVMEEAFFRQSPGPLPDVPWPIGEGDLESFIQKLKDEPDVNKRALLRANIAQKKVESEAKAAAETVPPVPSEKRLFAKLRSELSASNALPLDQREYIGPYEMSAQAITIGRQWQASELDTILATAIERMLAEAGKIDSKDNDGSIASLLKAEADAERAYPLYKLWRDSYRVYAIENGVADSDPAKAEFINQNRTPPPDLKFVPAKGVLDKFKDVFIKEISGREEYKRLAMARLSGPSLLSFRVNIEAAPGDSEEVNGLPRYPTDGPQSPGPGVQRFGAMPFTFEHLTDWSRHEPHVNIRAKKLYEPLKSGAIPPVVGRVASVDDEAILVQQGFERGQKTSEAHLGQVRASLKNHPSALETQIELPARVILSTAQNAIWQSPRKITRLKPQGGEPDLFETGPISASGSNIEEGKKNFTSYEPLWTARLITADAEPSLRAIWSPDVRPEAIGYMAPGGAGVPRLAGPPPRGPWAPWVLRREQVDGVRLSPNDVKGAQDYVETGVRPQKPEDDELADQAACKDPKGAFPEYLNAVSTMPRPSPTMFQRICEIFWLRRLYNSDPDLQLFRTSLDAYDRHELVLLSSAYGLPVTGRRQQIGTTDSKAGALMEQSGQFEPGTDFHLTDANPDVAFYRPKPLDVAELALSAVGGFLNHDTNFLPPAPGINYEGRSMFDGLSIERWQHLIVLGRDILATVVYSGYLFPLGHKASLVKITERVLVKMDTGASARTDKANGPACGFEIKAVLRQRMFVRVSVPTKKYPAVGQPNKGRQWCSEDVTMLTRETPDIVDPTLEFDTAPSTTSPSGRIFLQNQPGLVFWPQIAMTPDARVQFEFLVDGRRTKMPLVFVDRIAAKNEAALGALLQYYQALEEEPRTCRMGGQTLRYAESVKDGDTSFSTDELVLSVEGRASSDQTTWPGQNDRTTNNGVLEGADQPPFYPVMSYAAIRIEQAETMSGAAMGAARVRFDGTYVLGGFPPRADGRASASEPTAADASAAGIAAANNLAEAFLYVDWPVLPKMSMGPNGHQSGGVGRPNMDIAGLSRSKGILGAQPGKSIYDYKPSDNGPYSAFKTGGPIVSIARYFSLKPQLPATESADDRPARAPAESSSTTSVFESFFSADAKLLGVISFQSLMKLLTIVGGVNAMPALQEVVEYGSQALNHVKEGAGDALSLLQSEVLSPLLVLVRSARKQWSQLDELQTQAQKDAFKALQAITPSIKATSLAKLYPEIDRGLNDLEATLIASIAETDPVLIVARLAAVHEAGRRFMRELSRVAANPVERIEQAVRVQIGAVGGDIKAKIDVYQAVATDLVGALQASVEEKILSIQARLVDYLVDQLPWQDIEAIELATQETSGFHDLAAALLIELKKIKIDLKSVGQGLKDGSLDPAQALKQTVLAFVRAATDASNAQGVTQLLDPSGLVMSAVRPEREKAKEVLRAALAAYRDRLSEAEKNANLWIDGNVPPFEWATWVARVRVVYRLVAVAQDLLQAKEPKRIFTLLVQLGSEYLGVDIAALRGEVQEEARRRLTLWATDVVKSLLLLAGPIAKDGAINPSLPDFVIAACAAKLPVGAGPTTKPADIKTAKDAASRIDQEFTDKASTHFLAGYAKSVLDTFDADDQLTKASLAIAQLSPLPEPIKPFQAAIKDLKTILPAYRDLFCETALLVGEAQSAYAELAGMVKSAGASGIIDTDVFRPALARLLVLAAEIGQRLHRIRGLLTTIIETLSPHLKVVTTGAALAALAAALGLDEADLKAEVAKWDKTVALNLRLVLTTIFRGAGVIASAASADAKEVFAFVDGIVNSIPKALNPERDNLAIALAKLKTDTADLAKSVSLLQIEPPLDATPDPTTIGLLNAKLAGTSTTVSQALEAPLSLARTDRIESAVQNVSTAYGALAGRIQGMPKTLGLDLLDAPVATLMTALGKAYQDITKIRADILQNVPASFTEKVRQALLVHPLKPGCSPLDPGCDRLFDEAEAVAALAKIDKPVTKARNQLQAYCESISDGQSAVEQIANHIGDILDDIARGNLAALVDIGAMRDQFEELISQLIPVKRTLRYDLGFDFDPGKIASVTGGIFTPKPPSRFELSMVATIDLLKASADMKAKGLIGPFNVKLIGEIFEAVELIFDGVDFDFELGGSPRFDVHYNDFKIGPKLEFVQKLQAYMSPSKDGSGFFIEPMRGKPGIVAGYGINLGTIQLGGIAFSNILLNAAAELPFDGDAAMFRFALGRTLSPFLISVPPYGGGGYVAIFADAQGFRGVEASLEFGGVADFSTGPLVAKGRITAGFFIRSMKLPVAGGGMRTVTDIYGTFFAGGEASIWIFSFYASLYVRLGMKDGGAMEGVATFTFSFSMGIVDYDFSVTMRHERQAIGKSDGTQSIGSENSTDADGVDASIITRSTVSGKNPSPNVEAMVSPFGETTMSEFLAYFDLDLLKPVASK